MCLVAIEKRVKGAVAAVAAAAAAANKSPMHDPNGICTIYPTATLIVANGLQRLAIQSFSQVPQLRPLEREFPILVWKKLQVVIQQILHTKQTVSATELEFLGDAIEIIVDHLIGTFASSARFCHLGSSMFRFYTFFLLFRVQ